MITATARWANPSSTTASSRFIISAFNENQGIISDSASQMATSPYASPSGLLNGTINYGSVSIPINSASNFSGSGYIVMEDALIGYGSNSVSQLNSASWFSGYGTYLPSTEIRQAHESYSVNVNDCEYVVFTLRHLNGRMELSKSSRIIYYSGINPGNSNTCNVIITLLNQYASGFGTVTIHAELIGGPYYLKSDGSLIVNTGTLIVTSSTGIAILELIPNDFIETGSGSASSGYKIKISRDIDNFAVFDEQEITIPVVPNVPYVMLSDIAE